MKVASLSAATTALDKEINLTELNLMAEVDKKTKTEEGKVSFAKIFDTFKQLNENNNILRKVKSQQAKLDQAPKVKAMEVDPKTTETRILAI